jgi:O-methyltransferase
MEYAMIKLVLWGCGRNAERLLTLVKTQVEIIGIFDNDPSRIGTLFHGHTVYGPSSGEILELCDYILVTIHPYAQDVYEQLTIELRIDPCKIIALGLHWNALGLAENNRIVHELFSCDTDGGDEFSIHPSQFLLHRKMEWDTHFPVHSDAQRRLVQSDYTRYRTFELCADEILRSDSNALKMAVVAEVGVFRGDFASLINGKFPDKQLYLFDTFAGFDTQEYAWEKAKEGVGAENVNYFRDTSVDMVLSRMPHPQKCLIRKGYFPKTAEGLQETTYAFVSIDVDLHQSIYESLVYFYPRLVESGYLFIHEYNHGKWPGVKKAVHRYEDTFGLLRKVPLADNNGTVVIVK